MQSMRKTLFQCDVGRVAVAVLLLWALIDATDALGQPIYVAAEFIVNLIGTLDFSYALETFREAHLMAELTGLQLAASFACAAAAWVLSRWISGEGPLPLPERTPYIFGRALKRARIAIVESYVGAIGLGYLLAQCVLQVVNAFAAPFAGLMSQRQYSGLGPIALDFW